ncbi:MAG: radical SAM protein [Candidatus Omnitrophica bacterium]|nr:radical SAM protein [Candidatus Omnitrophota bacterium]
METKNGPETKGRTVVLIRPDLDKAYPFGKLPAYLPLGLGFIAGALKEQGFDIKVIDCYLDGIPPEKAAEEAAAFDPLFVGITVTIASVASACSLSRELLRQGRKVVIGGPQVTVFPGKTMRDSGADIGVIGEGEITLPEIAESLLERRKDLSGIKGIIYPDNGKFKTTPQREPVKDLDSLPFVPVELFPYKRYAQDCSELERSPLGWMSTSRGCPWDCSFCSNIYVWGRKYRCMSPERVFREMKRLKKDFGINALDFREDNFTVKRERVMELCDLIIKDGLDIEWKCESRVDIIDEELLSKMKEAGCGAIYFGIESGTQRVLDFLNKGFKLEQAIKAMQACRKSGIRTVASVMLGVPSQTLEENYQTIRFIKKLSPDIVYFNPFIGIPGSKTYDYIQENGLCYKGAGDIILANSEYLTWKEKLDLKQRAELQYNLSPRVLARHIRRIGLKRFIKKGAITLKRYFSSRKTLSGKDDVSRKTSEDGC